MGSSGFCFLLGIFNFLGFVWYLGWELIRGLGYYIRGRSEF